MNKFGFIRTGTEKVFKDISHTRIEPAISGGKHSVEIFITSWKCVGAAGKEMIY